MKKLFEIEQDANGYHFECWWDGELDIANEIAQAREHCAVASSFEVPVIISRRKGHHQGLVKGRNETQVKCVRFYLLDFKGWTKQQE